MEHEWQKITSTKNEKKKSQVWKRPGHFHWYRALLVSGRGAAHALWLLSKTRVPHYKPSWHRTMALDLASQLATETLLVEALALTSIVKVNGCLHITGKRHAHRAGALELTWNVRTSHQQILRTVSCGLVKRHAHYHNSVARMSLCLSCRTNIYHTTSLSRAVALNCAGALCSPWLAEHQPSCRHLDS